MAAVYVVSTTTGEEVPVPAGETQVGRGPFLKVSIPIIIRYWL